MNSSKQKGNRFERELVNQAKDNNISAKRAYASNGLSLGCTKETDCLIGSYRVQAKRRKKIASYMKPSNEVDMQIIREDRGQALAVIPFDLLLELMKGQ